MTHPYRSEPFERDAIAGASHPCILCRARGALARVPLRTVVAGSVALVLLGFNGLFAFEAYYFARLAERMVVEASLPSSPPRRPPPHHRLPVAPFEPALVSMHTGGEPALLGDLGIKVSATEFILYRGTLERMLELQSHAPSPLRVSPEIDHGKTIGVCLLGVEPGTLLGLLGIRDGDCIERINDIDITSPAKVLDAYARLRAIDRAVVQVNRGGSRLELRVHIDDVDRAR